MDLIINNDHGGYYYDLFFRLSFLIGFLIFLFEAWRRKYAIPAVLLISAVCIFFAVLGSKLSTYSIADWNYFFDSGYLPTPNGRSSLGALLFGWLGIGVAQRILRFKHSVLDLYILAVPAALISQRLGCLLAGCCFGSPTTLPWAMQYGDVHGAWKHHFAEGLILGMSENSLGVHPVPVYFIAAYLLCMLLVWRFKHHFRVNGNQALFGLVLIFGFRFIIEFFRDPITNHGWGESVLGIKQIQWLVLLVLLLLIVIIRFREHRYRQAICPEPHAAEKHFLRKLALLVIPLLGLTLFADWFSFSEVTVIHTHLVFAGLAMAWIAFYRVTHPRLRGITAVVLILAIGIMGQTYQEMPPDSLSYQPRVFKSISFGFLEGRNEYDYLVRGGIIPGSGTYTNPGSSECSSINYDYEYDYYRVGPNTFSGGLHYEYLKEVKPDKFSGWIIGGHLTQYNLRINEMEVRRISDYGLVLNRRWLRPDYRIDIGVHGGNIEHINGDHEMKTKVFPMLNLRLGPQEKLFVDAGYGSDIPFGLTTSVWKVGGGIGLPLFGAKYKGGLLFGATNIGERNAFYVTPYIPIGQFDLQPTYRFSRRERMSNWGVIFRWNLNSERAPQLP